MKNFSETIKSLVENNEKINQSEIARNFGVSRSTVAREIKKCQLETAGNSAKLSSIGENVDSYDIKSTENGAVSVTPINATPVAVGDVWEWGKGEKPVQGVVSFVNAEEKTFLLVVCPRDQPYKQSQVVTFKNWKKRPNKRHVDVLHNFIAAQAIALEKGLIPRSKCYNNDLWFGLKKEDGTMNRWDLELSEEILPYNHGITDTSDTAAGNGSKTFNDTKDIEVSGDKIKKTSKSMKDCPYKLTVSKRSITAVMGSEVLTVTADEPAFEACLAAVKAKDWEQVENLCRLRHTKAINYQNILSRCGFVINGGYVVMGNNTGKIALGGVDTILKRLEQLAISGSENEIERIAKFVDKVLDNPDPNIMNRIVDFIKFADVEIDENGDLITYKYVDSDYKDSYSKKLDNRPGSEVFMKRILVDSNIDNECSHGLHVCALSYAFKFWSKNKRLVRCTLNPRDIVAIPKDYKGSKIRCCYYKVISDVTDQFLNRRIPLDFKGVFG